MTLAEIKELSGMGFSNEQIIQLASSSGKLETQENQSSEAPADVPAGDHSDKPAVPAEAPASAPASAPADDPVKDSAPADDPRFGQMQKQIDDMMKMLQANNRATASVNIMPESDLEARTDAVMAELIRPTITKKGV